MAEILVVDDDTMLCEMLVEQLKRKGHQPCGVLTLSDGVKEVMAGRFDVVFLDVQMPDGNGLEFLPRFKAAPSSPEVIIMTGKGDPDGAEQAIKSGAWGYIEKPHVIRDLFLHLTRALEYREEKNRVKVVPVALKRENLVGNSPAMTACLDQIAKAAVSDISVLITGETGTGKDVVAKTIHENSSRSGKDLVVVDCTALPETLIESTLFGHVQGAFTGADKAADGLIKQADGGTLFLDEVGELPLPLQKAFLRVVQDHRYRPVGGTQMILSDFRLIVATNRDLNKKVEEGNFRSDLLFRLQAFSIHLPPLRDRLDDIRELTVYYLEKLCRRYGLEAKGVTPGFIEALCAYNWPGNVRELFQTLEEVLVNTMQIPTLFARHLPTQFRILQAQAGIKATRADKADVVRNEARKTLQTWRQHKDDMEKNYVRKLLLQANGNVNAACEISGLSRTRLYQLLNKYDLVPSNTPR